MVRKIKKKRPIAAPDEFIALPNRILDYIRDNWQKWVNIALGCLIVFCLIFIVKYWWQKKREHVLLSYTEAEQLLAQGQVERAEKILRSVRGSHAKIAKFAALDLAYIAEHKGKLEDAAKEYQFFFKRASKTNSLLPYVFHAISCDYINAGRQIEAQRFLNRLIKRFPKHPLAAWAYLNQGLLLEKKRPKEALKLYRKCVKSKDNPFVPAWLELKIKTISSEG